jgi:GNAT superfamily N-acetyltransferase
MNRDFEIIIRDSFENMDFDKVTLMLGSAFWSPGITKEEVMKGARFSALVAGAFLDPSGEQIGYGRVISDRTRFAYVLDVFVDHRYRRRGVGTEIVRHILNHEDLGDVYQWLLITRDAHGVYEKSGFMPLSDPASWMQVWKPRPER